MNEKDLLRERTLNDATALQHGAEYDKDGVLQPSEGQKDQARKEMERSLMLDKKVSEVFTSEDISSLCDVVKEVLILQHESASVDKRWPVLEELKKKLTTIKDAMVEKERSGK